MAQPVAVPRCPVPTMCSAGRVAVIFVALTHLLACDTPVRRFATGDSASTDAAAPVDAATDGADDSHGEGGSGDAGTPTESHPTSGSGDTDDSASCRACTSTSDDCDGGCSEASCEMCDATAPSCSESGSCEEAAPCGPQALECDPQARCHEKDGSWSCKCTSGYAGDGLTCEDVDECELGTHTCDSNAGCSNTSGSFTCTCKDGFTGDGESCQNVDECEEGSHDCGSNEACKDTPGSFTCECKSGFVRNAGECTPRITYVDFLPEVVNPDGTVVAGRRNSKVWSWTQTEGVTRSLEFEGNVLRLVAISADGKIVTGNGSGSIVRWIGTTPGVAVSFSGIIEPTDANDSGDLIVGVRSGLEAFAWDLADPLPSSPLAEATESSVGRIYALSGDGNLVTGAYPAASSESAFRLDLRQLEKFQTLAPPADFSASAGFDVSTDGPVVGVAWDDDHKDFAAVRWQDTEVALLTPPSGATVTRATSSSADGTRIIGDDVASYYPPGEEQEARAIYWASPTALGVFLRSHTETLGVDVEDVLEFRDATISDDGKTIVGTAVLKTDTTSTRGFILRIPD